MIIAAVAVLSVAGLVMTSDASPQGAAVQISLNQFCHYQCDQIEYNPDRFSQCFDACKANRESNPGSLRFGYN